MDCLKMMNDNLIRAVRHNLFYITKDASCANYDGRSNDEKRNLIKVRVFITILIARYYVLHCFPIEGKTFKRFLILCLAIFFKKLDRLNTNWCCHVIPSSWINVNSNCKSKTMYLMYYTVKLPLISFLRKRKKVK